MGNPENAIESTPATFKELIDWIQKKYGELGNARLNRVKAEIRGNWDGSSIISEAFSLKMMAEVARKLDPQLEELKRLKAKLYGRDPLTVASSDFKELKEFYKG